MTYPALVDGEKGTYGVTFPDLPGIVAMGETMDEALINAKEALRDGVIEAENDGEALAVPSAFEDIEPLVGQTLVSISLIPPSSRR